MAEAVVVNENAIGHNNGYCDDEDYETEGAIHRKNAASQLNGQTNKQTLINK